MTRALVPDAAYGPLAGAFAVLLAGAVIFSLLPSGPLSIQMAQHLLAMNVMAPLIALAVLRYVPKRVPASVLWSAALAQLGLLWVWHAPAMQMAAASSFPINLALAGLLLVAAVVFWSLLLDGAMKRRWSGIAVLLVTGKIACLLGVLMIFAARDLYLLPGLAIPFCTTGPSSLEDQQLAGLLMITACPLSYLVTGVVLAAQIFTQLDGNDQRELSRFALR